jgi:hypothetical protein
MITTLIALSSGARRSIPGSTHGSLFVANWHGNGVRACVRACVHVQSTQHALVGVSLHPSPVHVCVGTSQSHGSSPITCTQLLSASELDCGNCAMQQCSNSSKHAAQQPTTMTRVLQHESPRGGLYADATASEGNPIVPLSSSGVCPRRTDY